MPHAPNTTDDRYQPQDIEPKWQTRWAAERLFEMGMGDGGWGMDGDRPSPPSPLSHVAEEGEPDSPSPITHPPTPKEYVIEMFAYPSGDLHWGHVRNYTIGDVWARFQAARGKNVFHPFGFDAFGLPAEGAAIKRGIPPAEWTYSNIANMTAQLKRMGYSYDWSHTLNTCDPEYYRWNQWFFLKFLERGLAYKKKGFLNWCPFDKTVLANEQVQDGKCERCGTPVIKRELSQWFFRITDYADRLLENHPQLDWPVGVIEMQKNWIGRSQGALIEFALDAPFEGETLPVFTTRPDTLFGVTYMVLAPEHPLVARVAEAFPDAAHRIQRFVEEVGRETEIERTAEDKPKQGIPLPISAMNPSNGERIPVWIANYVLVEYGTGAVMAVPAHDERDFAFAKQYGLPIREVIQASDVSRQRSAVSNQPPATESAPQPPPHRGGLGGGANGDGTAMTEATTGPGVMVNSGPFNGTQNVEGKTKITEWLESRGQGKGTINYRLRDWCISRQRYWGTPIPVVYCDKCGIVPVPEDQLPVVLPTDVTFTPEGNPLATSESFVNTTCPQCGGAAKRETDTMDTFMDSSWYFLRYLDPSDAAKPFDVEAVKRWMPVDMYVGGREHATMHLIYARFFTMALHDMGLVDFDEPFRRLFNQGILTSGGTKMSKRGNATPPNQLLDKYGADACRLFILFVAPPEERTEWNEAGVEGTFRFLTRAWRYVTQPTIERANPPVSDTKIRQAVHRTLKRVTEDMEGLRYNTAISTMMEFMNEIMAVFVSEHIWEEVADALIQMLSPFAPHFASELWERRGHAGLLYNDAWPTFDSELAKLKEVDVVLQINGKVRDHMVLPAATSAEELERLARANEKVLAALDGKQIRKIIAVPDKLVNVVIG